MKTTTVPAQITTVEDRLAGNLSLTQLLLLVSPVFISCLIYVVLPPFIKISLFKVSISVLIFLLFSVMSIRIKGKIIILWLFLVMKYRNRPRYYLYDKNDAIFRKINTEPLKEVEYLKAQEPQKRKIFPN